MIDVDSLVNVRDSLIPMNMVSAVNLESHPAGRSEVQYHPSAANTDCGGMGSRNPRWD